MLSCRAIAAPTPVNFQPTTSPTAAPPPFHRDKGWRSIWHLSTVRKRTSKERGSLSNISNRVNCSFYYKIGACRHGDKCSRKHVKPNYSVTMLIPNIYLNPAHDPACQLDSAQLQQHFDLFYEDMFAELALKYGEVEEMIVCDNIGDHLIGNVYIRFRNEEAAGKAAEELNKRWYAGRPVFAELSPVTDFRESCCRQYENGECNRGGYCNFMHIKYPTRDLKKELWASQQESLRNHK